MKDPVFSPSEIRFLRQHLINSLGEIQSDIQRIGGHKQMESRRDLMKSILGKLPNV